MNCIDFKYTDFKYKWGMIYFHILINYLCFLLFELVLLHIIYYIMLEPFFLLVICKSFTHRSVLIFCFPCNRKIFVLSVSKLLSMVFIWNKMCWFLGTKIHYLFRYKNVPLHFKVQKFSYLWKIQESIQSIYITNNIA